MTHVTVWLVGSRQGPLPSFGGAQTGRGSPPAALSVRAPWGVSASCLSFLLRSLGGSVSDARGYLFLRQVLTGLGGTYFFLACWRRNWRSAGAGLRGRGSREAGAVWTSEVSGYGTSKQASWESLGQGHRIEQIKLQVTQIHLTAR